MKYNFKTYAPFTQRGQSFPKNIIRVTRTSMVISATIMEQFSAQRYTNDNGQERVTIILHVDVDNKAIKLQPHYKGYTFQCRQNGNGYINTYRLKLGLEIGDYLLMGEKDLIFKLAT